MAERYFDRFPVISYSNTICRDISRRVVFDDRIMKNASLFYPYELKAGLRADVLADVYYDDSYLDWLIYHTNGIIDPYYGWYLNNDEFDNFIMKKYGSLENATQRIRYYQTNWSIDDQELLPDHYNNLPDKLKKYYVPNYGYNTRIISYKRRREDWKVNTNRIYQITFAHVEGEFNSTDLVKIINETEETIGRGEINYILDDKIIIKNTTGSIESFQKIVKEDTSATADITNVLKLIENISDDEYVFWEPVYYYDYEREQNEKKKIIYLLDANHSLDVSEQFRKSMKEI